jgi:hypothetical protein
MPVRVGSVLCPSGVSLPILSLDRLANPHIGAATVRALLEPTKIGQIGSCHPGSSHFQTPFGSRKRFIVNS